MRYWLRFLLLLPVTSVYGAWVCDQGQELSSVKLYQMEGRDTRPFLLAMNYRYYQHVTPMRAYEAAHPDAKPNAYLDTDEGKKTAAELRGIKERFNYDAASEYLLGESLGDHPNNPERVDYTHIFRRGKKLFYMDGNRLVATRLKVNDSEFLLKIFNQDCSLREVVSLPTLDLGSEKYEYKINASYCNQIDAKAPTRIDADVQDEMKIYLPDEQEEVDKLKPRLVRDCKQSFIKTVSKTNLKSSSSSSTK